MINNKVSCIFCEGPDMEGSIVLDKEKDTDPVT